jgi:hypothetical protein
MKEEARNKLTRMSLDRKLGKIEEILSSWSTDAELCERLKEVKMILIDRINSYENED